MTTYGTMKARIADEAVATGLDDQIAREIQSAIAHYSTQRFHFNQGSLSFSTVDNQTAYGVADNANIPEIAEIQAAKVFGAGWSTRVVPVTYSDLFTTVDQETSGYPEFIAYRDFQIHLAPSPGSGYAIEVAYLSKLSPLVDDADSNAWMTIAEQMIRQRAKRMLYDNVLHNYNAADRAMMLENEEASRLKRLEMKLSHDSAARLDDLARVGPYDIRGNVY